MQKISSIKLPHLLVILLFLFIGIIILRVTAGTVLSSSNPEALIFRMENGSIISRKNLEMIDVYVDGTGEFEYLVIKENGLNRVEIFNFDKICSLQIPEKIKDLIRVKSATEIKKGNFFKY